jgi:hypothetical protein
MSLNNRRLALVTWILFMGLLRGSLGSGNSAT